MRPGNIGLHQHDDYDSINQGDRVSMASSTEDIGIPRHSSHDSLDVKRFFAHAFGEQCDELVSVEMVNYLLSSSSFNQETMELIQHKTSDPILADFAERINPANKFPFNLSFVLSLSSGFSSPTNQTDLPFSPSNQGNTIPITQAPFPSYSALLELNHAISSDLTNQGAWGISLVSILLFGAASSENSAEHDEALKALLQLFIHSTLPSEKVDVFLCLMCWIEIQFRNHEEKLKTFQTDEQNQSAEPSDWREETPRKNSPLKEPSLSRNTSDTSISAKGRKPVTATRKSSSKPSVSSQTSHAKSRPVIVKAAPKTSQQPRRFSKSLSTQRSAPIVPPADPVLYRELQVFHAIFPIVNTLLPYLRPNSTRILLVCICYIFRKIPFDPTTKMAGVPKISKYPLFMPLLVHDPTLLGFRSFFSRLPSDFRRKCINTLMSPHGMSPLSDRPSDLSEQPPNSFVSLSVTLVVHFGTRTLTEFFNSLFNTIVQPKAPQSVSVRPVVSKSGSSKKPSSRTTLYTPVSSSSHPSNTAHSQLPPHPSGKQSVGTQKQPAPQRRLNTQLCQVLTGAISFIYSLLSSKEGRDQFSPVTNSSCSSSRPSLSAILGSLLRISALSSALLFLVPLHSTYITFSERDFLWIVSSLSIRSVIQLLPLLTEPLFTFTSTDDNYMSLRSQSLKLKLHNDRKDGTCRSPSLPFAMSTTLKNDPLNAPLKGSTPSTGGSADTDAAFFQTGLYELLDVCMHIISSHKPLLVPFDYDQLYEMGKLQKKDMFERDRRVKTAMSVAGERLISFREQAEDESADDEDVIDGWRTATLRENQHNDELQSDVIDPFDQLSIVAKCLLTQFGMLNENESEDSMTFHHPFTNSNKTSNVSPSPTQKIVHRIFPFIALHIRSYFFFHLLVPSLFKSMLTPLHSPLIFRNKHLSGSLTTLIKQIQTLCDDMSSLVSFSVKVPPPQTLSSKAGAPPNLTSQSYTFPFYHPLFHLLPRPHKSPLLLKLKAKPRLSISELPLSASISRFVSEASTPYNQTPAQSSRSSSAHWAQQSFSGGTFGSGPGWGLASYASGLNTGIGSMFERPPSRVSTARSTHRASISLGDSQTPGAQQLRISRLDFFGTDLDRGKNRQDGSGQGSNGFEQPAMSNSTFSSPFSNRQVYPNSQSCLNTSISRLPTSHPPQTSDSSDDDSPAIRSKASTLAPLSLPLDFSVDTNQPAPAQTPSIRTINPFTRPSSRKNADGTNLSYSRLSSAVDSNRNMDLPTSFGNLNRHDSMASFGGRKLGMDGTLVSVAYNTSIGVGVWSVSVFPSDWVDTWIDEENVLDVEWYELKLAYLLGEMKRKQKKEGKDSELHKKRQLESQHRKLMQEYYESSSYQPEDGISKPHRSNSPDFSNDSFPRGKDGGLASISSSTSSLSNVSMSFIHTPLNLTPPPVHFTSTVLFRLSSTSTSSTQKGPITRPASSSVTPSSLPWVSGGSLTEICGSTKKERDIPYDPTDLTGKPSLVNPKRRSSRRLNERKKHFIGHDEVVLWRQTEYEQDEEKGRKSRAHQEDDSDSSLTPYPPQPAQDPLNSPTDNDHVEFEDGDPFKPITADQSENESSSIDSGSLFDTDSDSDQSWNEWGFGFGGVGEEKRKDWTNVAPDLYGIGLIVCLIKANLDKQIVHRRSRQTSRTLSASISSTASPPDRRQSVSSVSSLSPRTIQQLNQSLSKPSQNIPRLELLKLSNTTAAPRNDILAPVVPSSSQSPQIMRKNFPHSASSKEQRSSRRFQREKEIVLRSERYETIQRGLVDVDLDSRGEGLDDVLFQQDDSERKEGEPKARSRNSVSDWDSVRDNSKNELEDSAKRRFEELLLSSDRSDADDDHKHLFYFVSLWKGIVDIMRVVEVDRERPPREKGTSGQKVRPVTTSHMKRSNH
ncbi:hypothetical protein BLNAU_2729 [Blattamonas nauphoetae]|uniref:Uncharacterized protein n=1 Tax=Blattamonas nauphoetae TaxID=2049346 RepID=A0ABQ9YFE4_9EUKA|nr:hypothetical protein BLNAU_2729 [Blattamonas nauphoetae]